jgi:hypothetical protein
MKKYLIVTGLLAVIATPAFAQSYVPEYGTGNVLPFTYGPNTSVAGPYDSDGSDSSYAQAPARERSAHTHARTWSSDRDSGYVIGRHM